MPLELTFHCPLPHGVHARPASALEELARRFSADITVFNERTGQSASARSVLGMVGIDIRVNDPCRFMISGVDGHDALDALRRFLDSDFGGCDDDLPRIESVSATIALPPMLDRARAVVHRATPVSPGVGMGLAVRVGGFIVPHSLIEARTGDVDAEIRRLEAAVGQLLRQYDARIEGALRAVEADVMRAHRAILRDPAFKDRLASEIMERRCLSGGAIAAAEAHFFAILSATGSALLRERALDLRDVCVELIRQIYGDEVKEEAVHLTSDSVCVADALTPGQLLSLDRRHVKGIVLAHGGTTSHTVILARSFGIPMLVGISGDELAGVDGRQIVVDAELGVLVTEPTGDVLRYYDMERQRLHGRLAQLGGAVAGPTVTVDGRRIEVAANIATSQEAEGAFAAGAEGIGLFRTEMMFAGRDEPPTETEQYDRYRAVLAQAGDRPVIIRTLDVGGDKPLPYLRQPAQDNPFLGVRGVRLYPAIEEMIRCQVRALMRASAHGQLWVMLPMVSHADEVKWVRRLIAEEQARLDPSAATAGPTLRIGAMVEVPAAALALDHLAREADFFSIGTNDLLQYVMAADRTNPRVAALSDAMDPAFLRLLKRIVGDSHQAGRWIGVCGEMASDIRCLPLLVGLGVDEISVGVAGVPAAKAEVRGLVAGACAALLDQACACANAGEVAALLDQCGQGRQVPLFEPGLVLSGVECLTKEEAIKVAVDHLYVCGRTDRPYLVEQAIWQREVVYSTGFGHAFAIPHCRTDALRANSLVILRLKRPVDWGSLDERPVQVVILLAIRGSDHANAHLNVLAALSRQLMHEEFRDRVLHEDDAGTLYQFMCNRLAL